MCKIGRFREQLARARANYTRRWCPVCGLGGGVFVHFLRLSLAFGSVERVAEIFIVVPRPASAQKSQDVLS